MRQPINSKYHQHINAQTNKLKKHQPTSLKRKLPSSKKHQPTNYSQTKMELERDSRHRKQTKSISFLLRKGLLMLSYARLAFF